MAKKKSFSARIGRYLTEILIIIIGISLSFALNDWEQRKSDKKEYSSYLKRLQEDIRIDSLQMVNDKSSYRNKIRGVDLIFSYHSGFSRDSIALLGEAQNALQGFIKFLPNDNTFQILSSTGDFKVFTNDSLVSELFQLYRYDYAFIEMTGKEAEDERSQAINPYMVNNVYLEDKITFPQVRTNIPQVVQDRTFRNICLEYKESSYAVIRAYNRGLERIASINEIIRQELDNAGE
ncbi:MAG: hypothetical protein ABJM06_12835 [Gilvibacter sp.]